MARCYSVLMANRYPLRTEIPDIWLISDARNDARLETALAHLPHGSGLIFRHTHLDERRRRARFAKLARIARMRGHLVILSGSAALARQWGADGAYGPAGLLARGPACLRLVTAHGLHEIGKAHRARADALLLSPVFPTRSHPGADALGATRFRLLASRALVPTIALGGMTRRRAKAIGWKKWAAIDGL
ncbi:MAG: thiamine phosphate synthase [Sphingomonadaceae bacterium]|nr:thiamine phosphate synthase [Sphingomonadaceae bacterium]